MRSQYWARRNGRDVPWSERIRKLTNDMFCSLKVLYIISCNSGLGVYVHVITFQIVHGEGCFDETRKVRRHLGAWSHLIVEKNHPNVRFSKKSFSRVQILRRKLWPQIWYKIRWNGRWDWDCFSAKKEMARIFTQNFKHNFEDVIVKLMHLFFTNDRCSTGKPQVHIHTK